MQGHLDLGLCDLFLDTVIVSIGDNLRVVLLFVF